MGSKPVNDPRFQKARKNKPGFGQKRVRYEKGKGLIEKGNNGRRSFGRCFLVGGGRGKKGSSSQEARKQGGRQRRDLFKWEEGPRKKKT